MHSCLRRSDGALTVGICKTESFAWIYIQSESGNSLDIDRASVSELRALGYSIVEAAEKIEPTPSLAAQMAREETNAWPGNGVGGGGSGDGGGSFGDVGGIRADDAKAIRQIPRNPRTLGEEYGDPKIDEFLADFDVRR